MDQTNQLIYQNRQWWSDEERKPHPHVPDNMFRQWSLHPIIVRDITIPKDEEQDFLPNLVLKGGKYLEKLFKIDEFKNDTKHTVTYRIIFQSIERTLNNEEIDKIMNDIYATCP